jgi:hypothetical protein
VKGVFGIPDHGWHRHHHRCAGYYDGRHHFHCAR